MQSPFFRLVPKRHGMELGRATVSHPTVPNSFYPVEGRKEGSFDSMSQAVIRSLIGTSEPTQVLRAGKAATHI